MGKLTESVGNGTLLEEVGHWMVGIAVKLAKPHFLSTYYFLAVAAV